MAEQAPSKEKVDPLPERLRYLRPTAKYKLGKDCWYMVGELMHEAAQEIERLQAREREAFRLANAATYLVAPTYSLHSELKAFMAGQISKPEDCSSHEPPASLSIESFEHWATVVGGYTFNRVSPEFGRTYNFNNTEHAWRGWANGFAAGERAAQPPPVDDRTCPTCKRFLFDCKVNCRAYPDCDCGRKYSGITKCEGQS